MILYNKNKIRSLLFVAFNNVCSILLYAIIKMLINHIFTFEKALQAL